MSDLDGDGRQELTVLYSGEENRCMADCYTWDDRELSCISTLELSFSAPELSRVAAGALSDGSRRFMSPAWRTTAWRPTIS